MEGNYDPFLGYLRSIFAQVNMTLYERGIRIYDSNDTMWLVYNSTGSGPVYSRLIDMGTYARAYAYAIRAHEENNAHGEIPLVMKAVEVNDPKGTGGIFEVSSGMARLFVYNNISGKEYFQTWFRTIRNTTESEQQRASQIDASFRNVTYYPNGTWEYAEPPKSERTEDNSSESETDENTRLAPPPVAARSTG